jgi:hypothetical protein
MKKRLGNFLLLCGLICLVLFFTSNALILDEAIFIFGGVSLCSLGLLLKRGSRRKEKRRRKKRRDRDGQDQEGVYD